MCTVCWRGALVVLVQLQMRLLVSGAPAVAMGPTVSAAPVSTRAHAARARATASRVVGGRLLVGGEAFFPVGAYVHALNTSEFELLARSGYNTVLTYTNGNPHEVVHQTAQTAAATTAFLDAAAAHDIMVRRPPRATDHRTAIRLTVCVVVMVSVSCDMRRWQPHRRPS